MKGIYLLKFAITNHLVLILLDYIKRADNIIFVINVSLKS